MLPSNMGIFQDENWGFNSQTIGDELELSKNTIHQQFDLDNHFGLESSLLKHPTTCSWEDGTNPNRNLCD